MTRPPMTAEQVKGTAPIMPFTPEEWHALHMASARDEQERLHKIAVDGAMFCLQLHGGVA